MELSNEADFTRILQLEENYIKRDSIEEFKAFDSNGDRFITFEGETVVGDRHYGVGDVKMMSLTKYKILLKKFENLIKYRMTIKTQSTEKQFTSLVCVIKTKIQGYQNLNLKAFYIRNFSSTHEAFMFKKISKLSTWTAITKLTRKNFCENI